MTVAPSVCFCLSRDEKKNGVVRKQVSKISYIFINFYVKRVSSIIKIM